MDVPCPDCNEPRELLDGNEMGSAIRYHCSHCRLRFQADASGLITEVGD
jgi:hypothetical protein